MWCVLVVIFMACRKGEEEKTYFRMDRFYSENGQWRFMTREGYEMGPYDSKKEAEGELALYIRQTANPFTMGEYSKAKTDCDIWSQNFAR